MSRASGVPDKSQRNGNNAPGLLRAMPVKASVRDGKVCHQTTMRKRFERFGEVEIFHGQMALDCTF